MLSQRNLQSRGVTVLDNCYLSVPGAHVKATGDVDEPTLGGFKIRDPQARGAIDDERKVIGSCAATCKPRKTFAQGPHAEQEGIQFLRKIRVKSTFAHFFCLPSQLNARIEQELLNNYYRSHFLKCIHLNVCIWQIIWY